MEEKKEKLEMAEFISDNYEILKILNRLKDLSKEMEKKQ